MTIFPLDVVSVFATEWKLLFGNGLAFLLTAILRRFAVGIWLIFSCDRRNPPATVRVCDVRSVPLGKETSASYNGGG